MRIRDLGPLTVEIDGKVTALGSTKLAAVLARLSQDANNLVPAAALEEAGWGTDVAVSPSSLQSLLWRLRNLLEPDRSGAPALASEGGAYRLVLTPESLDSLRFDQLVQQVGAGNHTTDSRTALTTIDQALALWRGTPYEILAHLADTAAWTARLELQRDHLTEWRIDALLRLGLPERALSDVEPLLARAPYRERLWGQRMTALHQLSRTTEALADYQRVRRLLLDEVGMDPGPELQLLHNQILAGAPELEAVGPAKLSRSTDQAARSAPVVPPKASGPHDPASTTSHRAGPVRLPRRGTAVVGRQHDEERLTALLDRHPLVTITGTGGSGKTRLAVEVATDVAERYPGGVWFVDLTAVTEPHLVVDVVVSTLELGAAEMLDPLAALTEFARGRPMLLVLDNCEHVLDGAAAVADQLLALIDPLTSGPSVLATSREPLGLDGELIWSIAPLSLQPDGDPDGLAPAVRLLLHRVRLAAPQLEVASTQLAVVEQICRSLDGLPLAIELAAARVRSFSLLEIAAQVKIEPTRLGRVGKPRQDHRQSLYDAIEWSYQLMEPHEQAMHRRLSVLPGPFTLFAAVGVASDSDDRQRTADSLSGLAHRSMLGVSRTAAGETAFFQLDTVRSHAQQHLLAAGESDQFHARRARWVAELLGQRPRLGSPEEPAWYDRVEESYPTVRAALQRAVGTERQQDLIDLGSGLNFFWFFRSRMIEGSRWLEAALAPDHETGRVADLATRFRLVGAYALRFQPDLARSQLALAMSRFDPAGVESPVLLAEAMVCAGSGAWACQAFDVVVQVSEALSALVAELDDPTAHLFADLVACLASIPVTSFAETGTRVEVLYARSVQLDNLVAGWLAALIRCVAACETRDPDNALRWTRRAVALHQRLGSGGSRLFLDTLANSYALTGAYERAATLYSSAQSHARETGNAWPQHPTTRDLYQHSIGRLPPETLKRAWKDGEQLTLHDILSWTS